MGGNFRLDVGASEGESDVRELTIRHELHSLADRRSDSVLRDAEIGSAVFTSDRNELELLARHLRR